MNQEKRDITPATAESHQPAPTPAKSTCVPSQPSQMPQTITMAVAAQRLGLSECTVRLMLGLGQLRGWRRISHSPWHIYAWSVDDFIDAVNSGR